MMTTSKRDARNWLIGPMVAVATPFTENYDLDCDALRDNVRYMIDRGVKTGQGTLLIGGAGGEHPALNIDERKQLMTAAVDAANGEVPVLTSIQHTDVRVTVELAKHASEVGVSGAQLGPTYYYTSTKSDVHRLFELVTGESDIPIMIYNTWWDGFHMPLDLVRQLAQIESVVSLKWDAPDSSQYRETLMAVADELVVIDNSGQQVWSHLLGARGFITHLSGFWPEYPLEVWNLLEKRDYDAAKLRLAAFKWQWTKWRSKVAEVTGGEGPFIKAGMEAVGLKVGPPRPPSVRPPEHLLAELRDLLDKSGVPMAAATRT